MEKILRQKFILISVGVVFVVLLTMASVINIVNYTQIDDVADELIEVMAENDGAIPQVFDRPMEHLNAETPYTTRFFIVKVDENDILISADTRNVQMVNTEQAIGHANAALIQGDAEGFSGNYKYGIVESDEGKMVIFIDCSQEMTLFINTLKSSITISLIALFAVFILMIILSKKAVKPIVESYSKQQQFITNITHELKTPLAIIKTNTEVIEMENEESNWSQSIHKQIDRLNELINYLISLSKLEEEDMKVEKIKFDISAAATEVVDSFDVLAAGNDKTINTNIAGNLNYQGDEQALRLVFSILLDNAIKYGSPNSTINFNVSGHRDKVKIEVINEAPNLEAKKYDMLFERFYRLENSRNSKSGGFGIGLAMAKTIVKNHGGNIKAESKDGKKLKINIEL